MVFTVNEKDYEIKFAYKPTIKGKLLSKLAKVEESGENVGALETILEFVPEMLLIGLQKNHADEFGYDYSTNKGRDKAFEKVEDLISTFADEEGGDLTELYADLQNELLANGFLAKMFGDEVKKEMQKAKK